MPAALRRPHSPERSGFATDVSSKHRLASRGHIEQHEVIREGVADPVDGEGQNQVLANPLDAQDRLPVVKHERPRDISGHQVQNFHGADVRAQGHPVRVPPRVRGLQREGRALLRQKSEHAVELQPLQISKVAGAEIVQVSASARFGVACGHKEPEEVLRLALLHLALAVEVHEVVPRRQAAHGDARNDRDERVDCLRLAALPD
mmetsp:Transcript_3490/g.7852  ORF Transcript_3490/g.7852 Transcript_3490/m.7852 type:complete len:204 (-) Transcript_3490:1116-1727(-)